MRFRAGAWERRKNFKYTLFCRKEKQALIIVSATAIVGAYGIRPFAVEPGWANAIRPYDINHLWPKR